MVVGISRRVDDIVHVPFRSGSLDLVEICSGCGRIRTPDGEFVAVEELLSEVLGSVIQRGLCQACYELADPTDL